MVMNLSDQFKELYQEKGIFRQLAIMNIRQHNGVVELKNRTLLKIVKFVMTQANLPISFWGDALLTTTYILNWVPSKYVTFTPYKLWTWRQPELNHLRPSGSVIYIHDPSHKHEKLGLHGKKHTFISYPEYSKRYIFVGENTDGSIFELESCAIHFIENDFLNKGKLQKDFYLLKMDDHDSGSHQPS